MQSMDLVWAVGAMVIVLSALLARRTSLGATAKMAAGWVAIFSVGIVLFSFRTELGGVASRVWFELAGGDTVVEGDTVRVRKSADGHFWVTASINGHQERFLIDSGASITGLSVGAATRAGIEPSAGFPMLLETANGAVAADRATIATLAVGSIKMHDLGAVTAEEFGGTNVLGMNFLSSLSSWSVEGDWLVLNP